MIKKLNMISVTVVLTIIVFVATTAIQRFFVAYEPMVKVLVAVQDIQVSRPLDRFMFRMADIPISLAVNAKVVKRFDDIQGHYSTEPIHKGEILLDDAIALKNEIKIIEVGKGQEKISVKLKAPENAVSYQIKTGDKVNLYFTGKYGAIRKLTASKDSYLPYIDGMKDDYYCTIRILEKAELLGIFDEEGNGLSDAQRDVKIDTVIFAVSPEDAKIINNFKGQGSFDLTGLSYSE